MDNGIKCSNCGRFLSQEEMTNGAAKFHHEPLSDRGKEVNEWTCSTCVCVDAPNG